LKYRGILLGGICAVKGNNAEKIVKEMCRCLEHRGPDDEGFFFDRDLSLGHRALFKENNEEHQPLSNENKTIWITFDGEIYNAKQIRKQLKRKHHFQTKSCAELVIHSYEETGPDCLKKFNGAFAFCIWDSNKNHLFSARDHVGIKPLYYHSRPDRFLLASEIKALLTDQTVVKPNKKVIHEYLLTGSHSRRNGDTFFLEIKELQPSQYMLVDSNGIKIHKYHKFSSKKSSFNEQDSTFELRRLLQESIKLRLPENLPLGMCLSGGLDSTVIACLVDEFSKSNNYPFRQELYSAIYKEPVNGDERPYIEEVKRFLNERINYVYPSVRDNWDDIKTFVYYMDEPVPVLNYYVFWCLARSLSNKTRIAFLGQGSDALFAGQSAHQSVYLKELWRKKNIRTLLIEILEKMLNFDYSRIFTSLVSRDGISEIKRLYYGIKMMMPFDESDEEKNIISLLNPQFLTTYKQKKKQKGQDLTQILLDDLTEHAPEYLEFGDRAFSAFSVEVRYPYFDCGVIEFALMLPNNLKIRKARSKYILRQAMKGVIPEANRIWKAKLGAPIPLARWLKELNSEIRTIFESERFGERGLFNQEEVLNVFNLLCDGKLDRRELGYYSQVLWRVLNLELWFEAFFDNNEMQLIA